MLPKRYFLLALLVTWALEGFAQADLLEKYNFYLALDKPGVVKRLRYFPGDELQFFMDGDRWRGEILQVRLDTIVVAEVGLVPIRDIEAVIVPTRSWLVRQGSLVFPVVGIGYFLMDTLNPYNLQDNNDRITHQNVILSGSFVALGAVLQVFKKRKYKINQRHLLKTIEVL